MRVSPLVAALLLAAPLQAAPAADGITGTWVRANPAPGRPWAGYFSFRNGRTADRLVAAETPGARIEMHSMTMAEGVMQMRKLDGLDIAPGAEVSFAPGGNHLMLFDVKGAPKSLPITLVFASGARIAALAEVRSAAAGPPPKP